MNRQIIYLGLLACALNTCFTFQHSNLSSIFKFFGAENNQLPFLWLIPPLTGLIIQPIIGQLSDDTVTRFGKRRPYIFIWGFLASFAFMCLPFFNSLLYSTFLFLIIDCSLNGSLEAARALTGDNIKTQNERSKAFAFQATLSGIGGVIGASLPFLIHKFTKYKGDQIPNFGLPNNIKLSFVLLSFISLSTIYLCLVHIKEKHYRDNLLKIKQKKLALCNRVLRIFLEFSKSIQKMPTDFKKICYIHSMTWMGVFIFWLYITITLAQNIYGLPAHMQETSNQKFSAMLQHATLDSSFYFSVYQWVSVAYSIFIYFKSDSIKLYLWHAISLFAGGIGLLIIALTPNELMLIMAFILIGLMWGSMMILPYCIVMQLLPKARMGIYLGIFNICITFPQIISGLLLAPIYTYVFHEKANYLLVLASFLVFLSAMLWAYHENKAGLVKQIIKEDLLYN